MFGCCSQFSTTKQTIQHVFFRGTIHHRQIFHVHAHSCLGIFPNFPIFGVARFFSQQIKHSFVVQFQIRAAYFVFVFGSRFNFFKQLRYGTWNQSSLVVRGQIPQHGKGFPGSSLTVRKNRSVDAVQRTTNDRTSTTLVDGILTRVGQN